MSIRRRRLTLTAIASVAASVLIVAPVIYAFAQESPGLIEMSMAEQHAAAAAGSQDLQHVLAMDEEVKFRLDEIEKLVEKRFDDGKWYVTGLSSAFGFIFSVVLLVAAWNLKNERDRLREIEKDFREDVRNVQKDTKEDARNLVKDLQAQIRDQFGQAAQSQLELLGANGLALAGQEIVLNITKVEEERSKVAFDSVLRNVGNGLTGPIWLKLYTGKDLPTSTPSTDEPNYAFEERVFPEALKPGNLPGKYALRYGFSFTFPTPSPGRHPVLLRAFYGSGKLASAPFYLIVK